MLTPTIKICKEKTFCTCGAPNFRPFHSPKRIYRVYEVTIPRVPYGEETFHLCEDCIRKIGEALKDGSTTD